MPPPKVLPDIKEIAGRLRAARVALDLESKEAAVSAKAKPSTWSQYETGDRMPAMAELRRFCDVYDVPLDWIFRGKMSTGLKPELRKKIQQVMSAAGGQQ